MKKLFYLFIMALFCTLWSCSKSGSHIDEPDVTLEISTTDLVFEAKGGEREFTIYCNADWTVINESDWCTTNVAEGNGYGRVDVTVEAYSGMEDRNTNLTVKAGDKKEVLTVTQKHGNKEEVITMVTEKKGIIPLLVYCFEKGNIITVDWGDGSVEKFEATGNYTSYVADIKHEYSDDNSHAITIKGEIKRLSCHENNLTSLDVSKCTALTELRCFENNLASLDVSKNTALTYLDCFENNLTSLDVSKNTALTSLHCYYNNLTSLDVSKCTALTFLFCNENNLTSLDVSKNTALRQLWCYENNLTSLDISKNTALTYLWCEDNKLTSLDVSKCTALTELWCHNNNLTSLDVSKNAELRELRCYGNDLTSAALNQIFRDLPQGKTWTNHYGSTEQSTIEIGGNPGTETCDKSIAENKGWEVRTEW